MSVNYKTQIKLAVLSLAIPFSAIAAKENLVTCYVQDFKACKNCEERIAASCENHVFNGFLDLKLKPQKIQWLVSDTKSGSERIVSSRNSGMTLKDMKTTANAKALAEKMKVQIAAGETVTMTSIQVNPETALFKQTTGKEVASMKVQNNLRNIANATDIQAGGAKRAQAARKVK